MDAGKHFVKDYELAHMPSYSNYPPSLLGVMEVRSLIGRSGEIADEDINVSAFQLDAGADYGDHIHPHPEVYIFLSGTAECRWGDETFTAIPGTVTHCRRTCRTPCV